MSINLDCSPRIDCGLIRGVDASIWTWWRHLAEKSRPAIVIASGIETLGSYFAHAGQNGLVQHRHPLRHWPREVWLVHAEPGAKRQLATALQSRYSKAGKLLNRSPEPDRYRKASSSYPC